MSQSLLKNYPAPAPSKALVAVWGAYSQIFSKTALEPESLNQDPLQVDCNTMLIEVPQDKQGQHPHNNQHHKDKNHPNWQRPNNQKPNQQFKRNDIKVFQESGLSDDPDRKAWYYQDDEKQNQGPFSSREMDVLLSKNIVDYQTRVALDSLEKFVRIEKIVKVYQQSQEKNKVKEIVKNKHYIQEPFQFSGFTQNTQALIWFYKDQNDVKGPLSTTDMDELWKTSQINEETLIAFQTIDKFVKFEKVLKTAEEAITKKKIQDQDQVKVQVPAKQDESLNKKEEKTQQQPQKEQQTKQKPVATTSPVKQEKTTTTTTKTETVQVKKSTEVPQPEKKVPKSEVVQPQQKQPVVQKPTIFQQEDQLQEDDEWQQVGLPSQNKKKPKNSVANAQVPGLQTAAQIKGKQTVLQQAVPLLKTTPSQEQNQPVEDDEWQEVDTRKGKKK